MSSKWTNRLISKAAKLSRSTPDDRPAPDGVSDFLYGPGNSPPPDATIPPVQFPPQPKLDLEDNDNGLGEPLPDPNPAYALPPLRRGKGIHVGFTEEQPYVIGEGGDEAELPTMEVAKHAGQMPLKRSSGGDRPAGNGNDTSELHLTTSNGSELHMPPVTAPTVTLDRAPTTRKPNVGPGFLQKRRSFNMEEGLRQREAPSTNPDSVIARQMFGNSLDPNTLAPQPEIQPPPPPAGVMDRLKARHGGGSKMQDILNAMHKHEPPAASRKNNAANLWDQVLSHPDMKRGSKPSSPEPPAGPPPQMQTQIQNDHALPATRLAPHPSADNAPADAYAGDFRRGQSPSRSPIMIPSHPVHEREAHHQEQYPVPPPQAIQQSQVTPASPDSAQYSPYSPISHTLDRLMGPTQDISLEDRWKPAESYQPSGYAPPRQVPPPDHIGYVGGSQQQQQPPVPQHVVLPQISQAQTDTFRRPSAAPPPFEERPPVTSQSEHVGPSNHLSQPPRIPPIPADMRQNSFSTPSAASPSQPPQPRQLNAAPRPPGGPDPADLPGPPPGPPTIQQPTIPVLPPSPPHHGQPKQQEGHILQPAVSNQQSLDIPFHDTRGRGNSVDGQPSSRPSSSRGGPSPVQELPINSATGLAPGSFTGRGQSPGAVSPVQAYSPGRGPPPERSPPGDYSQPVYEPRRGSLTDDFLPCIDALQPCFTQAGLDAMATVGKHLAQWLRLASWWNLRGRKAFEVRIKELNENVAARSEAVDESLRQPFIEVAKAWWIVERIIPQVLRDPQSDFTQPSDGLEGPALKQVYHTLKIQVETFISSVSRRRLLPTPESLHINFTSFFVQYPQLPNVIRTLTAGYSASQNAEKPTDKPFFGIVLADTPRHFSYGHLFAETQVTLPHIGEDDEDEDLTLPCVISLIRDKSMSQMEMVICTQDGQVDLRIRADGRGLPSWKEVELRPRSHSIRIQLMAEFSIVIRLEKDDFKTLWGIREYNQQVMDEWSPSENERLIYETRLYDFNYIPPKGMTHPLPSNPIKDCAMRVYAKSTPPDQDGKAVHQGHRMVVITSPDVKALSNVSMWFDANFPILHSLLRGEQGVPALLLHVIKDGQPHRVIPAFRDPDDRNRFCEKLSGSYLASDEINIGTMKVTKISVSTAVPGTPGNLLDIQGVQWTDIHILSKMENGVDPRHSDRFRITADSNVGRLVDRPIIKPGELKIGLDDLDLNSIKLRRSQQSSLVVALMENKLPNGYTAPLQDAFKKKSTAASTIRYHFPSMADMHEFEEIVTGYRVLYDGIATYFSIKGQLKAAGISKKLEATRARVQIVQEEKKSTLQLLAYFKDMPDGQCMSFALSSTDHYEASHVSGKYYLRFVDARFGVPKSLSEPDATFVSLDMPEFAGERDDINVGFDKEEDRERLVEALPAAPTKASGLASFKRFVELGKTGGGSRPLSRQSQQ